MKKLAQRAADAVQIYIPVATFIALFVVFNMQVILRYVFRTPTIWSSEVAAIMFLWTVFLSTNRTTRDQRHVRFTMVYDAVDDKKKCVIRILGDLLIVVTYMMGFAPCAKAILTSRVSSTVLRIPLKYIYLPFLFFMLSTIYYQLLDMYRAFREYPHAGKKPEVTE